MDIPRNDKPTPEMIFAAAVWVVVALLVICFTNPRNTAHPTAKTAQAEKKQEGSRVELR